MQASAVAHAFDLALLPLDRVREWLLRVFAPVLAPLLRDRDLRVAFQGVLSVVVATALAVTFPLWLLTLAPLVLGVPHLLSDVRYLVVRQGLHRRLAFWPCIAVPALAVWVRPASWIAFLAVPGALLVSEGDRRVRALLAVPAVLLVVAVARAGFRFDVWMAHAHHVVALALWWAWARGVRARPWVVAALVVAVAWVFSGRADELPFRTRGLDTPAPGLDAMLLASSLSPVAPFQDPQRALRWLTVFALAQSVHYGLWLRLVPDEDRARRGPRSFRASARALTAELGAPAVLLFVLAWLGFLAATALGLSTARDAYLRAAFGHGALEVAVGLVLLLERGPRRA